MTNYFVRRSVALVFFFSVFAVAVSAQDNRVTIVSWNVESGGSSAQSVAQRIRSFQGVDIWGFSEVQSDSVASTFETAAEDGENANFERITGTTGGEDRLVIIFDADRFRKVNSFELHHINTGGSVRAPLVAQLQNRATGKEFLFMVNHLYRSRATRRHQQARLLKQWAESQVLPVVAVGDYNFDWEVEDGDANHDLGYDLMTQEGVWTWVRPATIIRSQCSEDFDSVLDFVFLTTPALGWPATTEIVTAQGDCPDNASTPDHRPVIARLDMKDITPLGPVMTIQPSTDNRSAPGTIKQQLIQRIEAMEAETRRLKDLVNGLP